MFGGERVSSETSCSALEISLSLTGKNNLIWAEN
jgi:hypothetical protein